MDDPDIVVERDETDNVSYGRLTVGGDANGPDLLFSTASLEDETVAPGGRVSVEYRIANRGGSDVGDFEVGYYLVPRNQNPPPLVQIFLERETLGGLDAGEDSDESEQVTIPANTAPGQYNFVIIADDRNLVEERDETNNEAGVAILTVTGTTAGEGGPGAASLALAVRPNPSPGAPVLSYTLAAEADVRLAVVDALGREVAVVASGRQGAGTHTASLGALPPGVYAALLVMGAGAAAVRFTIVR